MSTKLVIVESPAKAKTIGKILGKDYVIMASMGHIRDLPEKTFGVDIENGFQPQYEENKSRNKNLTELKKTAKAASEIYLAPDPDREGEAIAWHLKEVLQKLNKKAVFFRVTFHEITRSAITKAFQNIGDIDMNLVNSQQARRVLDRIVGYQVSPLLWSQIKRGVSAGRVQSVALRLVCEREREIQNFVPQEYWNFMAKFCSANQVQDSDNIFTAKLAKIDNQKVAVDSKEKADLILDAVKSVNNWAVKSIEKQPRKKYAAPPFITSTMQQAASSALGFSASQTMRIAQDLYEGIDIGNGPVGLITYMRTDSVAIAAEAQSVCRQFIAQTYGPDYVPEKPNFYKSKSNAQGAHEAIRPTDVNLTPAHLKNFLDAKQLKLYTLIWKRFVASQMASALQERTTVTVSGNAASDQKEYSFRSSATVTRFPGFMQAYNVVEEGSSTGDDDDENIKDAAVLGALTQSENCNLCDSLAEQKFTEPSPRFSEATLIKELELNGIGRPSTYATIVNTIQVREYVLKDKGKLIPTDLGFNINDYLVCSLPDLFQVGFTAYMEEKLDQVESGTVQWVNMLTEFYASFSQWLGIAKNVDAPAEDKAEALFRMLEGISEWVTVEKVAGKRVFDDRKFFLSAQKKFQKDHGISKKQWDVLLGLAVKYQQQIPALQETAQNNGFADDLAAAFEKNEEMQKSRKEWEEKRQKSEAEAPPQDYLGNIFDAMADIKWNPPEVKRGRTYDDKKFFTSLKNQKEAGKSLSEKQIRALMDLLGKYAANIPDFEALKKQISEQAGFTPDVQEDTQTTQANQNNVRKVLEEFAKITQWAEPVKKGRRVYDDKEFVKSLSDQAQKGKILSERQVAALLAMAAKYQINVN